MGGPTPSSEASPRLYCRLLEELEELGVWVYGHTGLACSTIHETYETIRETGRNTGK